MGKKRRKKSEFIQRMEYIGFYGASALAQALPPSLLNPLCRFLGNALYALLPRRRRLAVENLRHALGSGKSEGEIRSIARESCRSFFLMAAEVMKFRFSDDGPDAIRRNGPKIEQYARLFEKAKRIHDESGGCIFVTPHIGNWELLPFVSSYIGIPLAIVARPIDNAYLEKLIFSNRAASGQVVIPKTNAFFVLQRILRSGKSIGMLPDQSTGKGISVDFFGRKATATPIPALLAHTYKRPIVVVACCRSGGVNGFDGYVCDPIHPGDYKDEKTAVLEITARMTRQMESIIREHPEQYLWMHNRWKTYKGRKGLYS